MDETRTRGGRPRTVVLATDRSAASRAALTVVAGLAFGGGTEVVVFHVVEDGSPAAEEDVAADVATSLIALAVDARPEVRRARRGHVAETIAAAAAEHGADLVVLGSRGRGDLGGLLLGSVGQGVLERVGCPIMLVRAGRRASNRRRRILLAVAGDEDVVGLARTTAAVAEAGARVLVLHLVRTGDGDLEFARSVAVVEQAVAELRRCGIQARGRVRAGRHHPAEELARAALDYAADLIVMGSRRLPALTALLRGSVSHRVLSSTDRPVLLGARHDGDASDDA